MQCSSTADFDHYRWDFFTALYKKAIKAFLLMKVHDTINMIYWLAFIHMSSPASTILRLGELCVPALPLTSALSTCLIQGWAGARCWREEKYFSSLGYFFVINFEDWLSIQSTWYLCRYEESEMSSWSGSGTVRGQDHHFTQHCLLDNLVVLQNSTSV